MHTADLDAARAAADRVFRNQPGVGASVMGLIAQIFPHQHTGPKDYFTLSSKEAERVNAIVAQWNATLHLVSARRIAIENVAGHLLRRTYLTGGELRRILSGADAPDDLYRRMCAVHPGTHPDYWPIHWQ